MRQAFVLVVPWLVAAAPAFACDGDSAGVRAVAEGVIAADNGRDVGRVLGYYADDAVLMLPNEAPETDRAAIRRRYEDLFHNFAPQIDGRIDEICADGDLAFVRGEWKISRLMWHPAHGPAG
jgi:ketosteroid isomerase-like protein